MEPQNNTQFTGTSQSESMSLSQPKSGKSWKIVSMISIVLIIGLAAGLTFFFMKSNDDRNKIDDLQSTLDLRTAELNRFKEATGVDDPNDIGSISAEIDFSVFYDAMEAVPTGQIPNNLNIAIQRDSFIAMSSNGNYEIAKFVSSSNTEFILYFYRALPNGDWKYSNFSGAGPVTCAEGIPTEDEIAAFDGIVGCDED